MQVNYDFLIYLKDKLLLSNFKIWLFDATEINLYLFYINYKTEIDDDLSEINGDFWPSNRGNS